MVHVLILGGGLAGALFARKVRHFFPHRSILLLEQSSSLGGHHTLTFLGSDVTHEQKEWLLPIISKTWSKTEFHFKEFSRVFDGNCYCISAELIHQVLLQELGTSIRFSASVDHVSTHQVQLSTGEVIEAELIVDARGFAPVLMPSLEFLYQQFVGVHYEFQEPHGIENAVLMDTQVSQSDGLRYFSFFPLDSENLFIKETTYSIHGDIHLESSLNRIETYGKFAFPALWDQVKSSKNEKGFYPVLTRGTIHSSLNDSALPLIGARGGMFHPMTGNPIPMLMKWLDELSRYQDWTTEGMKYWTDEWIKKEWGKFKYYKMLNRIFFQNESAEKQMELYRKLFLSSQERIQRLLSGRLNWTDKAAFLYKKAGPVSIRHSISEILNRSI